MQIQARGWSRSVTGEHTVFDRRIADAKINSDGTIRIVGKSQFLSLTGNFRLMIDLTREEISILSEAVSRATFELKIEELANEIRALRSDLRS